MNAPIFSKIRNTVTQLVFVAIAVAFQTAHAQDSERKRLLIYGDSLSAAYGMDIDQGWVALLAEKTSNSLDINNASISGETTIGGLSRLETTLGELKPDLIFLELGANDGLRGLPVNSIRANMVKIIEKLQSENIDIILAGIGLPASYGPRYTDDFRAMYKSLAQQYQLNFIDLYDERFLGDPKYIQADGLHPTAISQPLIRDSILEFLSGIGVI